ncbi:hypothetical protein Tco_0778595, partial [Tanacetum coccineum]
MRRDLQLKDAEGVDCLPNATIFEQLTLMGYEKLSQKLTFYKAFFSPQWKFLIHTILQCLSSKTTAWNEFSSTMASAIICLATNQKFNFSKYILESMVKNLDNMRLSMRIWTRDWKGLPLLITTLDASLDRVTSIRPDPRRVKKLERRNKSRTYGIKRIYRVGLSRRVESFEDEGLGEEDASKQGRIADIDVNKDIYLFNVHSDEDMFGVNDLDGDEVIVESVDVVNTIEETRSMVEEVTVVTILVSAATTITTTTAITDVEITLAQALAE